MTEAKLLTVKEVCDRLAISDATLYRLINKGEIPTVKIGRSLRFDPADVAAYIERCKGSGI